MNANENIFCFILMIVYLLISIDINNFDDRAVSLF